MAYSEKHNKAAARDISVSQDYSYWGIAAVLLLLYLSPFVSAWLVYPAFAICIVRLIKYGEASFAIDYCILSTVSLLFKTAGGFSLLVVLCIIAVFWFAVRDGFVISSALAVLIIILDYLLLRMQSNYGGLVIVISQLILLYILLPGQDLKTIILEAKTFCYNMFLSSVYALIFRNSWQLVRLRGKEVPAYFGSSRMRFQGMFEDPNYYMVLVMMALVLLIKLRRAGKMNRFMTVLFGAGYMLFGIMTFSKTFAIAAAGIYFIVLITQFKSKNYTQAAALLILLAAVVVAANMFSDSLISDLLYRFTSAGNLDSLTTGRSSLLVSYWDRIVQSPKSILFGFGLSEKILQRGSHNLFMEIIYYSGITGLALFIVFGGSLVHIINSRYAGRRDFFFIKYISLIVIILLYFSLQGVFSVVTYAMFFLGTVSIAITGSKGVNADAEGAVDFA